MTISRSQQFYSEPRDGWVCFHCGERFETSNAARDHFGARPDSDPACWIPAEHVHEQLRAFRCQEESIRAALDRMRDIRDHCQQTEPGTFNQEMLGQRCETIIGLLQDVLDCSQEQEGS